MIQRTRLPSKRRGHHHAQIHFPSLTGHEALLVVNLLERVVDSLWRTHGDAMTDLLGCCHPGDPLPKQPDPLSPAAPAPSDDDIF
jgi:hypothetical protein